MQTVRVIVYYQRAKPRAETTTTTTKDALWLHHAIDDFLHIPVNSLVRRICLFPMD